MKKHLLVLTLLVIAAFTAPSLAHATFQFQFYDEDVPDQLKLYLDKTSDALLLTGHVGSQEGALVNIVADSEVNVQASGWATIQDNKGTLSSLLFTPVDQSIRYGDFTFRGQLSSEGSIFIKVIDNFGTPFVFEIPNLDDNENLTRMGVVSTDGQWLRSVELYTSAGTYFNQVKQIEFSLQEVEPIPEPGTVMLLSAGFLGLVIYGKRRKAA